MIVFREASPRVKNIMYVYDNDAITVTEGILYLFNILYKRNDCHCASC